MSHIGKFAWLAEQIQAVVKSRQASTFAAAASDFAAAATDRMADKTAQRAVKGTVRTVRTVKWVFYLFSIGTCCHPMCSNRNGTQGSYGLYVRYYGWAYGGRGGGKVGIMNYEKHRPSGEQSWRAHWNSPGKFPLVPAYSRIFPHFTDFKCWRAGFGILGRFGRGMWGRGMGKGQCLAIIAESRIAWEAHSRFNWPRHEKNEFYQLFTT